MLRNNSSLKEFCFLIQEYHYSIETFAKAFEMNHKLEHLEHNERIFNVQ
jgi:hypothetical protein